MGKFPKGVPRLYVRFSKVEVVAQNESLQHLLRTEWVSVCLIFQSAISPGLYGISFGCFTQLVIKEKRLR